MQNNRPLTINVIDYHEVTITSQAIVIVWSCFPDYRTRKTEYTTMEFLEWMTNEKVDQKEKSVDPFWLMEEINDIILFSIQDFHAENTSVYWAKQINHLNHTIKKLNDQIRSLWVVIEKLQRERDKLLSRLSKSIKSSF